MSRPHHGICRRAVLANCPNSIALEIRAAIMAWLERLSQPSLNMACNDCSAMPEIDRILKLALTTSRLSQNGFAAIVHQSEIT